MSYASERRVKQETTIPLAATANHHMAFQRKEAASQQGTLAITRSARYIVIMMFLDHGGRTLAISQPTHAWVAGRLLRNWVVDLDATLLLAAEQHDIAWLDWETRPVFDPATGRPKLFRDVGAADHAPVWAAAVERARTAWGTRVALMISRHGGVIYTRFTDRHRMRAADAHAASAYLARQAPLEAAWTAALGLSPAQLDRETNLIALADTLSLGLCGGINLPLHLPGPGAAQGTATYRMERRGAAECTLFPWPFAADRVTIEVEVRPIADGRFADGMAMAAWLARNERANLTLALSRTEE